MVMSHVCLFTYANELLLQVRVRELILYLLSKATLGSLMVINLIILVFAN